MSGLDHPFFRVAWRRYVLVGICYAWGAFEFLNGARVWGGIFVGLGLYASWVFWQTDWSKYDDKAP